MEDFKRENPEVDEKDLQVELPKAGSSTGTQQPGLPPNMLAWQGVPGGPAFLGGVMGGPQLPLLPNYNLNFGADPLGYRALVGDHRALQMLGPPPRLQRPPPQPQPRFEPKRGAVVPRRR